MVFNKLLNDVFVYLGETNNIHNKNRGILRTKYFYEGLDKIRGIF